MYKDILRTMNSEAFMASLALIVFFVFFMLVILDAWRKSKEEVHHLEQLPLDDDELTRTNHPDHAPDATRPSFTHA